jgi:hypothetical protein
MRAARRYTSVVTGICVLAALCLAIFAWRGESISLESIRRMMLNIGK